jgi:hypothetical protein
MILHIGENTAGGLGKDRNREAQHHVHDPWFGRRRNLIEQDTVGSLAALRRLAQNETNYLLGAWSDPDQRRTRHHCIGGREIVLIILLIPSVGANLDGGFNGSLIGNGQTCRLLSWRKKDCAP